MVEVAAIVEALERNYPDPRIELRFSTPLELLIATILSAQCTDERVNIVTQTLFKKYRSAGDYASADINELEEEIRTTGFFKNKARMIIGCARKLDSDFGGKVPDTLDALTTLSGVGRKTASVVLIAAFGVPAIAVDTHVLRVSNRLGLVSIPKDADKVEMTLRGLIPKQSWIGFTLSVVLFGRHVCKAKKPLCGDCFLYEMCQWPDKNKHKSKP
ncbi:MAG: endonuclease III [Nitrospirae bacterium]|nr:endonuclease III [Nitrospirota bacterium]